MAFDLHSKVEGGGGGVGAAAEMVCAMGIIVEAEKLSMPGFAPLDGMTITGGATTYAKTAAAYPEYVNGADLVLSPHHGRVTRMLDPTGTVDPDGLTRGLGSLQADEYESHTHLHTAPATTTARYSGNIESRWVSASANQPTTASGGSETRMKNIAVNRFIPLVA